MFPEILAPFREPLLAGLQVVVAIIIASGALQNLVYVSQTVLAYLALRRRAAAIRRESGPHRHVTSMYGTALPVSILAPAYNEELSVVESVKALLALDYPRFEVIVINDGSTDATLARLIEVFGLRPDHMPVETRLAHAPIRKVYVSDRYTNLVVIDKENGGKGDALNAGINASRYPFFCAIDVDSILEGNALRLALQPFVEQPDRMTAVGGTIRVANGCAIRHGRIVSVALPDRVLPLLQSMEYLRAFLMARLGWSEVGALMLISGAFGVFKRHVVVLCGGYSPGTVGEDFELTVKIHRYMRESGGDYEVRFVPEPACWTEVPETLGGLQRQRRRWQRGALETFFSHSRMLMNPRYGRVGVLAFLQHLITDVIGPTLEVFGYILIPAMYLFGVLDVDYLLAFIALTFVFGVAISVTCLALEEMELRRYPRLRHLAMLGAISVIENFGYRQLNTFWRFLGTVDYLRGATGWGRAGRKGFRAT
jgi:cellulose synthase/poly-beta-1,6-N-acetylglucosamine synthase-like glycosyltransferase